MTGLKGNSEFSFPSTLDVPRGEMARLGETKLTASCRFLDRDDMPVLEHTHHYFDETLIQCWNNNPALMWGQQLILDIETT